MISWDTLFLDNTLYNWLRGILIVVLTYFILVILRRFFRKRSTSQAGKATLDINNLIIDLVYRTKPYFLFILALYFGSLALTLPESFRNWMNTLLVVMALLQAAFWGLGLIDYLVKHAVKPDAKTGALDTTTMNALRLVARIALWSLVVLLILENLTGIEVNALIASLGVGGIAIALAVQKVLGDLFASLTIALDKPFAIGDNIAVAEFQGTVEHIGLKSTRVRSISGEQLIFSNSDLLGSRIRNYGRMQQRRGLFTLGVSYETPVEKLEAIPDLLRTVIEEQPGVVFSRANFIEIADGALNFECVYFVETPDIEAYANARQAINLGIMRCFQEHAIDFAGAATTIVVENAGGV